MSTDPFERTLHVVEDVALILEQYNAPALIIGGLALAVHRYPRDTVDVDLAIALEPRQLDAIAQRLRASGYDVEVRAPDAADPLGGVIDVRTSEGDVLVQVVNFSNPPTGGFPRLVADALATSMLLPESKGLRVVDLPHLIAFKLYAGGRKSELDILELLARNPELDVAHLRQLCESYRLTTELEAILGA